MIFVIFTRHAVENAGKKQADYQKFRTVEEFVDWYRKQGDKLVFSLSKGSLSYTQNGWVAIDSSPAQVLQATDTSLKMVTTIDRVTSDEGIIFEHIKYCSDPIVDCVALKCEISQAGKIS